MSHFDEHTLYFTSEGPLTNKQLSRLLDDALKQLNEMGLGTIKSEYNVNLVENKSGEYQRYGYIRIHNSKFFHALIGNNLDGTERVKWVKDLTSPSSKSQSSETKSPIARVLYKSASPKKSWADLDEEENGIITPATSPSETSVVVTPKKQNVGSEESISGHKIIKVESKVGMTKEPLSPLITLNNYAYTPEQKQSEQFGSVNISRAKVGEDPNTKHNVLFSQLRGVKVSKEDIFDAFACFGVAPVIKLVNGICYAEFTRGSMEAQFVLFMCRKLNVKNQMLFFGKSNTLPPEKRHQRNQRW